RGSVSQEHNLMEGGSQVLEIVLREKTKRFPFFQIPVEDQSCPQVLSFGGTDMLETNQILKDLTDVEGMLLIGVREFSDRLRDRLFGKSHASSASIKFLVIRGQLVGLKVEDHL